MATMSPFTSNIHDMPPWKCVFQCCDNCPSIFITGQKSTSYDTNTHPTPCLHVNISVLDCTVNGLSPFEENNMFIVSNSTNNRNKYKSIHTKRFFFN